MTTPTQTPNMKLTMSQVIINLFQDTFKQGPFKVYREGDPIIFPASMLPAMFVSEPITEYTEGPTGFDAISHQILIQIVFNKKAEFGAPKGVATLDNIIDQYVHGRDPSTGDFLSNTIMGTIRRNISFNNMIIGQKVRVEKYTVPRSDELWTVEAQIRITIDEEQAIANRS